uniref:WD_REPEATS_REGION domain-containing protein n=1 Tax=Macrostomum lignano TaxID=282301 RepID=A0A1I8F6K5_9PLAT
ATNRVQAVGSCPPAGDARRRVFYRRCVDTKSRSMMVDSRQTSACLASGSDDASRAVLTRIDLVCKETWDCLAAAASSLGGCVRSWASLSGSVDRSIVRLRNLAKEQQRTIVREHAHFVQGIAWRSPRTIGGHRRASRFGPFAESTVAAPGGPDDSWKYFFRRTVILAQTEKSWQPGRPLQLGMIIYLRFHLFGSGQAGQAVRVPLGLPASPRRCLCVLCQRDLRLAYSSATWSWAGARIQQDSGVRAWCWNPGCSCATPSIRSPSGRCATCHYQALNDAAWSADGSQLVLASTDGYCSIVRFGEGDSASRLPSPEKRESATLRRLHWRLRRRRSNAAVVDKAASGAPRPPRQLAAVAASSAAAPAASPGDPLTRGGQKRRVPVGWRWRQFGAWNADKQRPPMTTSVAAAAAPSTVASTSAAGTPPTMSTVRLRKKRRVSFFTISSCVRKRRWRRWWERQRAQRGPVICLVIYPTAAVVLDLALLLFRLSLLAGLCARRQLRCNSSSRIPQAEAARLRCQIHAGESSPAALPPLAPLWCLVDNEISFGPASVGHSPPVLVPGLHLDVAEGAIRPLAGFGQPGSGISAG